MTDVAPASVRARMFSVYGNYSFPAIVLGGDRAAQGDLVAFHEEDIPEVLDRLDRLEGFRGPGSRDNLYDRVLVEATTEAGETVKAWAYVWPEDRLHRIESRPIPSGDWLIIGYRVRLFI